MRIQIRPLALPRFCLTPPVQKNTADGTAALEFNETGSDNTATGAFALFNHTTGDLNTAVGTQALFTDSTGGFNTANDSQALLATPPAPPTRPLVLKRSLALFQSALMLVPFDRVARIFVKTNQRMM